MALSPCSQVPRPSGGEPDDGARATAETIEHLGAVVAVVAATVAEDDQRGAAIELVGVAGLELTKGAAVVRVAGHRHHSATVGSSERALDRACAAATEERRRLADLADEDEAARLLEELLRRVGQLQHEARGGADRVADVAEDDEDGASRGVRFFRASTRGTPPVAKARRRVRRGSMRPVRARRRRTRSPPASFSTKRRTASRTSCTSAAESAAKVGVVARRRSPSVPAASRSSAGAGDMLPQRGLHAIELARERVDQRRTSFGAERVDELTTKPGQHRARLVQTRRLQHALPEETDLLSTLHRLEHAPHLRGPSAAARARASLPVRSDTSALGRSSAPEKPASLLAAAGNTVGVEQLAQQRRLGGREVAGQSVPEAARRAESEGEVLVEGAHEASRVHGSLHEDGGERRRARSPSSRTRAAAPRAPHRWPARWRCGARRDARSRTARRRCASSPEHR